MRHRKLAWFCLCAASVAVCLALWGRDDSKPRPVRPYRPIACSVSFKGYSNSPSGHKWAVLVVTNRDFGELSFSHPCSLFLSNHPSDVLETHWQLAPSFAPHTSRRIAVEIPPESGTWRARFFLIRTTWRDSVRDFRPLSRCPDWLLPHPTYSVGDVVTEWVTQ
jgi:hypothetical protein